MMKKLKNFEKIKKKREKKQQIKISFYNIS